MNIEFDGLKIKYPNGYEIECEYNEDDYSYLFHVVKDGRYILHNMCILKQAHDRVASLLEDDS